eukprot:scaffold76035_cov28-Tisochrysis_lutea.AAC.2
MVQAWGKREGELSSSRAACAGDQSHPKRVERETRARLVVIICAVGATLALLIEEASSSVLGHGSALPFTNTCQKRMGAGGGGSEMRMDKCRQASLQGVASPRFHSSLARRNMMAGWQRTSIGTSGVDISNCSSSSLHSFSSVSAVRRGRPGENSGCAVADSGEGPERRDGLPYRAVHGCAAGGAGLMLPQLSYLPPLRLLAGKQLWEAALPCARGGDRECDACALALASRRLGISCSAAAPTSSTEIDEKASASRRERFRESWLFLAARTDALKASELVLLLCCVLFGLSTACCLVSSASELVIGSVLATSAGERRPSLRSFIEWSRGRAPMRDRASPGSLTGYMGRRRGTYAPSRSSNRIVRRIPSET